MPEPRLSPRDRHARSLSERIGEHLSVWRRLRDVTQADMAARTGMSARTLAKIEAGDPNVSLGKVLAVARIVGVSEHVVEAFSPLSTPEGLHRLNTRLPRRVRRD